MNSTVKYFVEKYVALDQFCRTGKVDKDMFRLYHDEYAKRFQKLDFATQGEICHEINKYFA